MKNNMATRGVAVVPSDTVDLASPSTGGLCVGVDGDICVILLDDTTPVTLKNRVAGDWPYVVKRVLATGTTATNIVALY